MIGLLSIYYSKKDRPYNSINVALIYFTISNLTYRPVALGLKAIIFALALLNVDLIKYLTIRDSIW